MIFCLRHADADQSVPRLEPFDHGDWLFELKFDVFRAAADTVRGRLISRNGDRLRRFEGMPDLLPRGCVFDVELVVLDDAGRPLFNELLFGRGRPTYVAFDLLARFFGRRNGRPLLFPPA
jgi:bifunctional non-homologous end joining protein LigD